LKDEQALLNAVKVKLEKNNFGVIESRSVQRAFSTELEIDGTGTISISSVERALNFLKNLEKVDAIWLDHNLLGEENGLDFVTKFKANGDKWNKIPIFVVSNTSNPALVKSYNALGVTKYFVKAEHKLEGIIEDIKKTLV
jgi:CheY-like chemotaxis protein